ncbi:MAG: RNA 2',3'-cyclic phosphodiesterase [Proteobacteria bacterium]|nr:RNA 2',3'-cyclic phosphodiesterase [Pseudomonadota bacterium]
MRLFVGLALPESVSRSLREIQNGLPEARWIEARNMHLTLCFIGDVEEDSAEDLDTGLAAIRVSAFDLALGGVDCFQSRNRVRAVWIGTDPAPALTALQAKVEATVRQTGLEPERRKFVAHITLARLRNQPIVRVQPYLEQYRAIRFPSFTVDQFSLFRSHLGHGGAEYERLADYPLQREALS